MNTILKAYSFMLTLLSVFAISLFLTSCDKPQLDNVATIPADAVLFSELTYTMGWAEVGTIDKVAIYTNGVDFILGKATYGGIILPAHYEHPRAFLQDLITGSLIRYTEIIFYTPKELTSEYFVL